MKNNTAIVDCKNKTLVFMFLGELHTIDLREGDLPDNWNAIMDKNKEVWDVNFSWDDSLGEKPYLTLYAVTQNEDGTFPENSTQWDNYVSFSVKKLGTRDDYFQEERFKYRFDPMLPLTFRVYDANDNLILKTKRGNRASDETVHQKMQNNKECYIVATDSNGATKKL